MTAWILNNKELFIGVLSTAAIIFAALISKPSNQKNKPEDIKNSNTNINTIVVRDIQPAKSTNANIQASKESARILFVDDDTTFQVVKIIKKSGWDNVRAIKDVDSIDSLIIKETDLFFIDIQGVGKALKFNDEGLGLALALKNRYPAKKVVIYSSEPRGDRFHQAFRVADDFLSKTAEPYEFQQVIENLLLHKGE